MKKNAIENQFREKINAREIASSKASWDRLDAMLTVAEKPKRNFKWMYVAAIFLGFGITGTLYFNQNKNKAAISNDTIVVNESKATPEAIAIPFEGNKIEKAITKTVIKEKLASREIKSGTKSNSILSYKVIEITEKEEVKEQSLSIINQKAEQKVITQKSKYVNVDELLASVDNASQKKGSMIAKSNVKVNSNELLSQVDGELDLTFREKAINAVNQKFKTAKLALSNRNSE
jgi:hypothetical protein